MENRLNYNFPSGRKKPAPKHSPMKNIIIIVLIVTNFMTLALGLLFVDALHDVFDSEQDSLLNDLDKFYFGFCLEAKEAGMDTMPSYQRLCGNE